MVSLLPGMHQHLAAQATAIVRPFEGRIRNADDRRALGAIQEN
jgi:hypothetical protein